MPRRSHRTRSAAWLRCSMTIQATLPSCRTSVRIPQLQLCVTDRTAGSWYWPDGVCLLRRLPSKDARWTGGGRTSARRHLRTGDAGWALFIDMPRGSARSNLANLGAVQLSRSIINGFADSLLVVFQEIMGIDLIDHLNRC